MADPAPRMPPWPGRRVLAPLGMLLAALGRGCGVPILEGGRALADRIEPVLRPVHDEASRVASGSSKAKHEPDPLLHIPTKLAVQVEKLGDDLPPPATKSEMVLL